MFPPLCQFYYPICAEDHHFSSKWLSLRQQNIPYIENGILQFLLFVFWLAFLCQCILSTIFQNPLVFETSYLIYPVGTDQSLTLPFSFGTSFICSFLLWIILIFQTLIAWYLDESLAMLLIPAMEIKLFIKGLCITYQLYLYFHFYLAVVTSAPATLLFLPFPWLPSAHMLCGWPPLLTADWRWCVFIL